MGAPLTVLNLSQQTDSSDLLGGFRPVQPRDALLPLLARLQARPVLCCYGLGIRVRLAARRAAAAAGAPAGAAPAAQQEPRLQALSCASCPLLRLSAAGNKSSSLS